MRSKTALLSSVSLLSALAATTAHAQQAPAASSQAGTANSQQSAAPAPAPAPSPAAAPQVDYSTGKPVDVSNGPAGKAPIVDIDVTYDENSGGLGQHQGTGSRLGLTVRETPATIDIVTARTLEQRGYSQVEAAVDSTPGTISGGSPGDPTGFSMRGFTGDEITILRNGVYVGPSDMVNRPENSFNLQDVEVLKGPASVLYGQGAVGGVINIIPKQPTFGPTTYDALFSYGSFGTINAGVGFGTAINDKVAVRVDLSRTSSNGFIHNDSPDALNLTASALVRISDQLQLEVSLDIMNDDLPSYYGTPLIPVQYAVHPLGGLISSSQNLTIDGATRNNNYNVSDSVHRGTTILPTATLSWEPADNVVITDEAFTLYAHRRWQNAETYTYLTPQLAAGAVDAAGLPIPAGSIGRDRFHVYHEQHYYVNQLHGVVSDELFGLTNKFTVGVDSSYLEFVRSRGFPDAQYADFVNAHSPDQGRYGNYPGDFPSRVSPTYIGNVAGLFEDVLSLTPNLKLVTGARYDWLDLDRQNLTQTGDVNSKTSFKQTFHPINWRVGLTYDVIPDLTIYAQYTTAQDPPGANIFLANRGQLQGLSKSRQEEAGLKGFFLDGKGQATLAVYHIERQNILVTTSQNTVSDVGSQHSAGVEVSTDVRLTPNWTVNANAAYTRARYGTFFDPFTGGNDDGHKPPNVPAVTANLWTAYRDVAELPLDLGAGLRFVGQRAGDYQNSLTLDAYTLVNLYATYHVVPGVDIVGRIDNLFDKNYVQWADTNYPSEVLLGRPRYFEIGAHMHI